jgi:hypothetical protein
MKRLVLVQTLILTLLLAGCRQFFVGFVSNPGGNVVHISGTVVAVQIGFFDDRHGTSGTFTSVTFVNAGTSTAINVLRRSAQSFPNQSNGWRRFQYWTLLLNTDRRHCPGLKGLRN